MLKVTKIEITVHLDNGYKFPMELDGAIVHDSEPTCRINDIIIRSIKHATEPDPRTKADED
jgi:hypothetical protein